MLLGRAPKDADAAAVTATGLAHQVWLTSSTAPLFLLVHGRAGNRRVMWTFSPNVPLAANILTPEGFLDDPDDGGRSWWVRSDFNAETVARARDRLASFLDASLTHYDLHPTTIVAIGFSQGGAVLAEVMRSQPERFAGLALLASFIVDHADDVNRAGANVSSPSSAATKIFIAHGQQDAVIPLSMAERGRDLLAARGHEVEFHADDVEHKVGRTGMKALKSWAARFLAQP